MDKILNDLWYGNIAPWEQSYRNDGELKRLAARLCESHDALTEGMTEAQREMLEEYDSRQGELGCVTEKNAFIQGFRLGIRLLLAAIDTQTGE